MEPHFVGSSPNRARPHPPSKREDLDGLRSSLVRDSSVSVGWKFHNDAVFVRGVAMCIGQMQSTERSLKSQAFCNNNMIVSNGTWVENKYQTLKTSSYCSAGCLNNNCPLFTKWNLHPCAKVWQVIFWFHVHAWTHSRLQCRTACSKWCSVVKFTWAKILPSVTEKADVWGVESMGFRRPLLTGSDAGNDLLHCQFQYNRLLVIGLCKLG